MAKNEMIVVEKMNANDYLRQPYTRSLTPQPDGTYHAEIIELPGCFATGATASDAYGNLEDTARSWFAAALHACQTIPPPMDENDFSGKIVVRMPRSLHRKAAFFSKREDVSLNQFIVACIAEGVGAAGKSAPAAARILTFQQINVIRVETASTATLPSGNSKLVKQYARH